MAGVCLCHPALNLTVMAKYDPKVTEGMVAWLRSDHTDDESIRRGAELLLRVNRNKGLFERICRYPKGGLKKLEYEIKKHVNIRLQGYSFEDIQELDKEVTPQVQVAVDAADGKPDGEIPVIREAKAEGDTGCVIVTGKRPDHDQLPEDIQAIWPENAERWKKIKETYNLLLTLNAPCDRFEHLQLLKETWYKYREQMCRYDEFKADGNVISDGNGKPERSEQEQQMVDYAQSYLSRYLPQLLELADAAKEPDFSEDQKTRLEDLRVKIQDRVNILLKAGVILSDDRKADLTKCDIRFDLPQDNAEGEGSE